MPESDRDSVVPAQLSFLAVYNPTLGPTDETTEDQIVFYTSRTNHLRDHDESATEKNEGQTSEDEKNERLRQIGLAQGMVDFASNFSNGKPLEYVETEKARVVLLELEKDWWIVASVDLTRLPLDPAHTLPSERPDIPSFQYSSREMGPPSLLIQQLRRAHSIFLLHHDFTLGDLYNRVGRSSLCLFLERFWDKFAWNWELLLTGNPIVEIYNGIKLSAGGELGVGVGEEGWGSGEREVLEDFVSRTEGLVDLVVSRFGDPSPQFEDSQLTPSDNEKGQWLGSDTDPRSTDGVVFSGVGALSRYSLAHVSHWMEWVYRYGDAAYGVGRDPNSLRRRKSRKQRGRQAARMDQAASGSLQISTPDRSFMPGIPRPLVMAEPRPIQDAAGETASQNRTESSPPSHDNQSERSAFGTETVMKYLTLGYGSSWSFSPRSASTPPPNSASTQNGSMANAAQQSEASANAAQISASQPSEHRHEAKRGSLGHFVLGPRDDLETLDDLEEESPAGELEGNRPKSRIVHRTLHIRLADASEGNMTKLQAVIYVNQPFMFTFLFDPETPSLTTPSLYSSIHHQLGPLQKPLLASTSPTTAASRISQSENTLDPSKSFSTLSQPVYDLVYDPSNLTIRSSIPNIPCLGTSVYPTQSPHSPTRPSSASPSAPSLAPPAWSRVESIAIHQRLLTTYTDTRTRPQELESTCKTSRGWWIIWMRISPETPHHPSSATPPLSSVPSSTALSTLTNEEEESHHSTSLEHIPVSLSPQQSHEAFLVRKASDYVSPTAHARISSGARFFRDLGGASSSPGLSRAAAADTAPARLVEGLGLDARRYLEGLLNLNR